MNKIENNYNKIIQYFEVLKMSTLIDSCKLSYTSISDADNNLKHAVITRNIVEFLKGNNDSFFYVCNVFKGIGEYLSAFLNKTVSESQATDFMFHLVKKCRHFDFNKKLLDVLLIYLNIYEDLYKEDILDIYKNLDFTSVLVCARNNKMKILNNIDDDQLVIDYNLIGENIVTIFNCIINKERYNLDDISSCIIAFKNLGLSSDLLNAISNTLILRYERRLQKNIITSEQVAVKKEVKKSNLISDKEYRSILKEIRKYFNPYTVQLTVEEISEEERNHVFSLMVKIDLDKDVIVRFMRLTEKEEKHTYAYFKDHIDEFSYYYQEYMETLLDYYNELKNCLDEEKEFWINAINDVIDKIRYDGKLDSYEYEIRNKKLEMIGEYKC